MSRGPELWKNRDDLSMGVIAPRDLKAKVPQLHFEFTSFPILLLETSTLAEKS